jgi:serine/threonine protein kinase
MSKATNPEGKLCFLKRFHAVAGDDQTKLKAHKQFQASMAAVRALTHDSILRPTGYFVENNDYILEMPYCAGGTLTQWLERGTRSLTERHSVAVRLVAALRFMHAKGEVSRGGLLLCLASWWMTLTVLSWCYVWFVNRLGVYHRDLKPGNVMMDEEGLPLLIDFEFSSFDRSLHSGLAAVSSHGGFVGTLWYAAPESLNDSKHKPQRSGVEKEVLGCFLSLLSPSMVCRKQSMLTRRARCVASETGCVVVGLHFA